MKDLTAVGLSLPSDARNLEADVRPFSAAFVPLVRMLHIRRKRVNVSSFHPFPK